MNTGKSPVALFTYNRPRLTTRTFNAIRAYEPEILFIFSDGPKNNSIDQLNVAASRQACAEIDWPCQVIRFQYAINQGCRESISQGLAKIFDQVQKCIILEDDCLPEPTFFTYCEQLLNQYRENYTVTCIGGYKPDLLKSTKDTSYFFSRYPCTWGWATWRRAYKGFNPALKSWSEPRDYRWLSDHLGGEKYARYWAYMFEKAKRGEDYWDYAWAYHCWKQNGLAIRPTQNLIKNIGFDLDATSTTDAQHPFARTASEEMLFPMHHPETLRQCERIDAEIEDLLYSGMRRRQLRIFHKIGKQRLANIGQE